MIFTQCIIPGYPEIYWTKIDMRPTQSTQYAFQSLFRGIINRNPRQDFFLINQKHNQLLYGNSTIADSTTNSAFFTTGYRTGGVPGNSTHTS